MRVKTCAGREIQGEDLRNLYVARALHKLVLWTVPGFQGATAAC